MPTARVCKDGNPRVPRVCKDGDPTVPRVSKDGDPTAPRVCKDGDPTAPRVSKDEDPTVLITENNFEDGNCWTEQALTLPTAKETTRRKE